MPAKAASRTTTINYARGERTASKERTPICHAIRALRAAGPLLVPGGISGDALLALQHAKACERVQDFIAGAILPSVPARVKLPLSVVKRSG